MSRVSKKLAAKTSTDAFYRFLCYRLVEEHLLYIPSMPVLPPPLNWRRLFVELFALRNIWFVSENASTHQFSQKFKISVFARFRPKLSDEVEIEDIRDSISSVDSEKEITLPLHQRLSLIRMSHGLKKNGAALRVLASEGQWFGKKWENLNQDPDSSDDGVDESDSSNPSKFDEISKQERQRSDWIKRNKSSASLNKEKIKANVHSIDCGTGQVILLDELVGIREFSFDGVFNERSSQFQVYYHVCQRLIIDVMNGFNASIIAYGQTSSGKTFTMFGPEGANLTEKLCGVIPRACSEILTGIDQRKSLGIETVMSVSYIEIFGDTVSDLLNYGRRCGQNKASAQRFVLAGAAEHSIHGLEDVIRALEVGEQQKRRAATAMNERSSRAHSIFIVTLEQFSVANGLSKKSRLFMADLGGSERVEKSKIEGGGHKITVAAGETTFSAGFFLSDRMRETVNINLGLLALKKCIQALQSKASYVPFQDSKLTMILSPGLGGDCKTAIIVCGNTGVQHANETMATMRFGEQCSYVETEINNESAMLAGLLGAIDSKIEEVEALIKQKERWGFEERRRLDGNTEEQKATHFGEFIGGVEVMKVTVLVGAEKERKELEQLLRQRAVFTGQKFVDEDEKNEDNVGTNSVPRNLNKTVAFGRQYAEVYGLGKDVNNSADTETEKRFLEKCSEEELPTVVRSRAKGHKHWDSTVDSKDIKRFEKKRGKLVYSGLFGGVDFEEI